MADDSFSELPPASQQHFSWMMHSKLQRIVAALEAAKPGGSRFVGGCVRDSLLGHGPAEMLKTDATDIDIATQLLPDEIITALKKADIGAHATGYEHGTITAACEGVVAEITSLRADVSTDGRRATVAFTQEWGRDWQRRDFTINAIYLTPEGHLYDPSDGRKDLEQGCVRFIGDAVTRLQEDYLRILRFYRFTARFAHQADAIGRSACKAEASGLKGISAERIGSEFLKILDLPKVTSTLDMMRDDTVLAEIYPQAADINLFSFMETLMQGSSAPVALRGLAALWPEETETALDNRLKLSNAQSKRRRLALKASQSLASPPNEPHSKELLYQLKEEAYTDGLWLSWARAFAENSPIAKRDSQWQQALSLPGRWIVPKFPVDGAALARHGVAGGPEMGRLLKELEDNWIAAGFPMRPEEVERLIISALKSP